MSATPQEVSIPYSSGHLFRSLALGDMPWAICPGRERCLNPLFIRSSIPFQESRELMRKGAPKSQSLIHQVIYSVRKRAGHLRPALSGLNPLFIRSSIPLEGMDGKKAIEEARSQSLIHQVIYSVGKKGGGMSATPQGLNPLFIRSSIPLSLLPLAAAYQLRLYTLVIRSCIPL